MLDLIVRIPNFGLIIFYIIFIILIPLLIYYSKPIFINNVLPFYSIIILGLASILTSSGHPYIFQNLYPIKITNSLSWISKNFISLMSICGILLGTKEDYLNKIKQYKGQASSNLNSQIIKGNSKMYTFFKTFLLIITSLFFLPNAVNIVIDRIDILMEKKKREFSFNIHKFFAGLLVLILVFIVNYFILKI